MGILARFWNDDLGFCHCADPSAIIRDIGDYLQISQEILTPDGKQQYAQREDRFGRSYGLLLGYLMARHNLTEHGGSINAVWLTEKGKSILKEIRDFEGEDLDELISSE